ncbi:MAG: hypothetical protein ACHREM_28870 [Polyangiales bacterium]
MADAHPPYWYGVRLDSFESLGPFERGKVLHDQVEVLITANRMLIRAAAAKGTPIPRLYVVEGGQYVSPLGVRYVDTYDEWRDVLSVARELGGDCKDLIAIDVAQLRELGEQADPRIVMIEDDAAPEQVIYHVLTERQNGTLDDVSKFLGMP